MEPQIHRCLLVSALIFSGLIFSNNSWAQRSVDFAEDVFGYSVRDSAQCAFQWLDISGTGQALSFQASGAEPADDDGGVVLSLAEPFEFYGQPYQRVVVSSNGYVAFAEDLQQENGADYSNDCPLPAVPDNGAARLGRIAVFHDDLQAGGGGQVLHEYQASCQRPGPVSGEACTVIQWQNWDFHNNTGASIAFEVLLYHHSREIVAQYDNAGTLPTLSATMGVQNPALSSAAMFQCNQATALPSDGRWCLASPQDPETLLSASFEHVQ